MNKSDNKKNCTSIGGQAVLEGVMMRGKSSECISVRDEDGIIRTETYRITPPEKKNKILKLPIIRGVCNFFSSLVDGTKILMRSASVFGEEEPSKFEKAVAKKFKVNVLSVVTTLSVALGLFFAVLLFVLLPQVGANLISKWCNINKYSIWFNIIEGLVRILIFITYILLVSLLKDIKRVFMYHGAEHKTISCYESGLELNVENVKKCSRVHNRCGTTFLFYVMFISIIVFSIANSLFQVDGFLRFILKILLLPVVAGLSYEVLKLLARTDNKFWLIFKAPGLLLQKLTTKEPDEGMIEVAINSFNTVLKMDSDPSMETVKFVTARKTNEIFAEISQKFIENNIDIVDAEWIISIVTNQNRSSIKDSELLIKPKNIDIINKYVIKRLNGEPLQYIVGDTNFYGYIIKTDSRALIPRPETEELVCLALNSIDKNSVCLDLCTGTGAIAITLKKQANCTVFASDVSQDALDLAMQNAELNEVQINFILSDLFENINQKFDVIISNPPYIPTQDLQNLQKEVLFEPRLALDGGIDGLDFYKSISKVCKEFLNDNGVLFLEFGIGQEEDIKQIFSDYTSVEIFKDLNGIYRMAKVTK